MYRAMVVVPAFVVGIAVEGIKCNHLTGLIQTIKRTGAKAIVLEPYYDRKTADFLASKTGATVVVLPPSVGGQKGLDDYLAVMTYNIRTLAKVVQ